MSLIIAANLVDRIYMCADTRLSLIKDQGRQTSYEKVHDDQLKIIPIVDSTMAVGCVGSPSLGAFLLNKILDLAGSHVYIRDLRRILKEKEAQVKSLIDEYLCLPPETSYKYANCVLLFAGQDQRRKRKINGAKLHELAKNFQRNTQAEFEGKFSKKPIEMFSQAELGRFMYEMEKTPQMGLKHVVFEGINQIKDQTQEIELNLPDQFIFAIEIRASNIFEKPDEIILFKDFEWGETPVYGGGYDAGILPPTFFGTLDLSMGSGNIAEDIIPFVLTIRDKYADTIGGSITNIILKDNQISTIAQSLYRKLSLDGPSEFLYHTEFVDKELHHYQNGKRTRLVPFTETKKPSVNQAMLIE